MVTQSHPESVAHITRRKLQIHCIHFIQFRVTVGWTCQLACGRSQATPGHVANLLQGEHSIHRVCGLQEEATQERGFKPRSSLL